MRRAGRRHVGVQVRGKRYRNRVWSWALDEKTDDLVIVTESKE
jgi:hypothetical protein